MFKFGEIVHVDNFPFSEKEEDKARYAVIVSNGKLKDNCYVLAAITTKFKNDEYSIVLEGEIILKPLKKVSEIRAHKLWTGAASMLSKFAYARLSTKGEIILKDKIKNILNH